MDGSCLLCPHGSLKFSFSDFGQLRLLCDHASLRGTSRIQTDPSPKVCRVRQLFTQCSSKRDSEGKIMSPNTAISPSPSSWEEKWSLIKWPPLVTGSLLYSLLPHFLRKACYQLLPPSSAPFTLAVLTGPDHRFAALEHYQSKEVYGPTVPHNRTPILITEAL